MPNTTKRAMRKPLTETQQEIALRYLSLARSLAKPFKLAWPSANNDFESAACMALVEAAEAFDPERNVKFATFARHRICGALRDVQRSETVLGWRCDPKHAPKLRPIQRDAEVRGRVLYIEEDGPVGSDMESTEYVEALLRQLPTKHAAAFRLIYLHGKSQHEAASDLGCSQARICYMHSEAISILNGSWQTQVLGEVIGKGSPNCVRIAFDDPARNLEVNRPEAIRQTPDFAPSG